MRHAIERCAGGDHDHCAARSIVKRRPAGEIIGDQTHGIERADEINHDGVDHLTIGFSVIPADQRLHSPHAGAGHQDARRTHCRNGGGNGALQALRVRDVAGQGDAAHFLRRGADAGDIDVQKGGLSSGLRQHLGRGHSHARTGTSNDGPYLFDFHYLFLHDLRWFKADAGISENSGHDGQLSVLTLTPDRFWTFRQSYGSIFPHSTIT